MKQAVLEKTDEKTLQNKGEKAPETLLQHIEHIIESVENSGLSEEFYQKARKSINFLCKKMNFTENQVILFSVFLEKGNNGCFDLNDLSKFIGCRNVKTITLTPDIEDLEKRRLIRCSKENSNAYYRVPYDVIKAVRQNIVYHPESTRNIGINNIFAHIARLFEEKSNNEISYAMLYEELLTLLDNNASLTFSKQVREYVKITSEDSFILLITFCHFFVNLADDRIGFHDLDDIYEKNWRFHQLKTSLTNGEHELLKNNILENWIDSGFSDVEYYRLTNATKQRLFAELEVKIYQTENKKGLILTDKIIPKVLYYNEKEQSQIDQLASLLNEESFKNVQKRLSERNMRKGFACLFYGTPGTGKTETVYQIARVTGRDIFMVNISEIKSKWVGESEKNIKALFDEYRLRVSNSKMFPILLFNEADALLGTRMENTNHAVDKMENSIQNIILQEMENLDGIMIATTNLTQNLDKAFERRFIYKIEFHKPCSQARKLIWESMLPSVEPPVVEQLAESYEFSGGEIENIVRKHSVEYILSGKEPTAEVLHEFCRNEKLNNSNKKRKVGFL